MHNLHELLTRAIGGIWFRRDFTGGIYRFYKFHEADAVQGAEFIYTGGSYDASELGHYGFTTLQKFSEMSNWEEVTDKKTLDNLTAGEAKKMIEISMV